ncbi:MAG: MtnX-like HAD-IB family phosphatase [Candidatus Krumholzibacteriia bacterium]|nr:MtnX-like HAD-IB family phosphatase [bacterium]
MSVRVFTDFDGTITAQDTLVYLLDRYVGGGWLEIEARVEDGTLSEEQGLRDEIGLLTAPWDEAVAGVLADVPVDAGFAPFAAFCAARDWPLTILSGGLEPVIRAVLDREGLGAVPLRANGLDFAADGRWRVVPARTPRINRLCNHCKSWHLGTAAGAGHRTIYIGDGTTDRCPAGHADLLFAKGSLAAWCEARAIAHHRFTAFDEIRAWFESPAGAAWIAQEARGGSEL